MYRKSRLADVIFTVVLLAAIIISLSVYAPFRIGFKEQVTLFSWDWGLLSSCFADPALLATILGEWLTTFFIHNAQGIVISALLLCAVAWSLMSLDRLSDKEPSLALIAGVVLLEEYFLTFLNYPLSRTVSLLLSVLAACAVLRVKNGSVRFLLTALGIPVMFVLAGGHALTFALLCCIAERKKRIGMIIASVAGVLVMMVCGRLYNLSLVQTLVYPMLPLNVVPAPGLMVVQFICAVAVPFRTGFRWNGLKIAVLSVLTVLAGMWAANDKITEYNIRIGTNAYNGDWKKVLMDGEKNLTRYGLYYRNLYYARLGRLPDNLLTIKQDRLSGGLFLQTGQSESFLSSFYYTDALLEMGNLSEATDCALLGQTAMNGERSSRMMRRLAEISVAAGDYEVAGKYLRILEKTRNHRAWARNLQDCIAQDKIPEQYLLWRGRTSENDIMYNQGDNRSALKIIAAESPMNKIAVDYLLCSYLIEKNVNSFVAQYERSYLNGLDRVVNVPDLYQEALLVNVDSDESLRAVMDKYHLSESVVSKYMSLMNLIAEGAEPQSLPQQFHNTYWYYIMSVKFDNNIKR